jgi:hypothetical protein
MFFYINYCSSRRAWIQIRRDFGLDGIQIRKKRMRNRNTEYAQGKFTVPSILSYTYGDRLVIQVTMFLNE